MLRGRWIVLVMAVVALAGLLASGCANESSRPSDRTTGSQNINDEVGGFTSQNEQPAFGNSTLLASGNSENPENDPMNQDPDVRSLQNADSTHVYAVTMLWGQLSGDPSVGQMDDPRGTRTDWSGSLHLNRGAAIVASTIAFEHDDHLAGRTDPRTIAWVSYTTTSYDGIRVVVYQPFENGNDGSADSMTVVLGSHTWVFHVNDLRDLDTTEVVDAIGNKFAIRAMAVSPRLGSRGFLGGAWLAPQHPDDMGIFLGRWISNTGNLAGYMKGFFGTNAKGEKVFYGKCIDLNGSFRGFLRGQWGEAGLDVGESTTRYYGWFRGQILNADRTPIGTLSGHWRSSRGGTDGFFQGVWFIPGLVP